MKKTIITLALLASAFGAQAAQSTLTCDVVFTREGKVTSKQTNYAEIVEGDGYFAYDAAHGNRGDSTGNNAFDSQEGEGEPNRDNLLTFKNTEESGAKIYESRVLVNVVDEPHKYVYALRVKPNGSREFYVTDVTARFGLNMINCK